MIVLEYILLVGVIVCAIAAPLCKRLLAFDVHYLMTMDGTAMSRETKAGLKEQQERTYRIFGEMGRYCRDTYGIEILMHPERCSLCLLYTSPSPRDRG